MPRPSPGCSPASLPTHRPSAVPPVWPSRPPIPTRSDPMHEQAAPVPRRGGTTDELTYEVGELTRVEGEGSLRLVVRNGEVVEAKLGIFEAPRYFEQLVVGRTPDEVIDIVARICGICPVAYQMSAVHAFEDLFGVEIEPEVRTLRRLLYCGEWIQSHALHIYMLHAPDFLGYPSVLELAADHREIVAPRPADQAARQPDHRAARRPVDPPGQRAGRRLLASPARPGRRRAAALTSRRRFPRRRRRSAGSPASSRRPTSASRSSFRCGTRPSTRSATAGSSRTTGSTWRPAPGATSSTRSRSPGPTPSRPARTTGRSTSSARPLASMLAGDQLHPLAAEALAATGLADEIRTNVFRSIVARAVELLHALRRGARHRRRPTEPAPIRTSPGSARAGIAAWATEAPRGLLFHRYEVDEAGLDPPRADRPADQPEPGRHRERPGRLRAEHPRAAARGGDAPASSS